MPSGFESRHIGSKKPATELVTGFLDSVVPPAGCRVRLAPPAFAASLRSLRAALENASRFLSSAPLRVRIPPLAHKKALQVHKGLERCVLKGWDGGIRTPNSRHQKPEFYR